VLLATLSGAVPLFAQTFTVTGGATSAVGANSVGGVTVASGLNGATTGQVVITVYSGGSPVGTFTLSASGTGTGGATFATPNLANGITSDGSGLWYADGSGASNTITLNTPGPFNYDNGAPICFKVAYPVTASVSNFSIENGPNTKTLQLPGAIALTSGDAPANTIVCAAYNTSGGGGMERYERASI
jgi:hypothetical protein